ncbi:MAG TPA: hypothetical protein PKZ52_05595 [Cellvibrionaceae bacterium]|nr:hypothetical protein [Cellvibrionaceae bacterium]
MTIFTSFMAHAKDPTMYPRVIQLPDAELRFSMMEDFSNDMPAEPLIEKIESANLSELKNITDRFVIGRRWWDLKPPGWFKKSWGSIQMTLMLGGAINKQGAKLDFCTFSQADFMVFYHEALVEKWRKHNESITPENQIQFGVYVMSLFGAIGQEFIPHSGFKQTGHNALLLESVAAQDANIYSYYSIPVGRDTFLEFEFIGAPDLNGSPYLFQAQADERINSIRQSVALKLDQNRSCVAGVLDKWVVADSVQLLKPDPSLLPKPAPSGTLEKFFPEKKGP